MTDSEGTPRHRQRPGSMITWISAGVAVSAMGAASGLALAGQTAVALAVASIGVAAFGTASVIRITVIIRR